MNMANDELQWLGDPPELRAPILLTAFAGWNDAGDAATYAVQTLINAWSPSPFAELDPEMFFDFTETRPLVSLDPTGQRSLEWPENVFHAHRMPTQDHDVVLLLGTEPQLRWRTFCGHILTVAERLNVSCLVTLGALLADVPHTRDPMLSGYVSTSRLLPQLQQLGVKMSSYEGPTGIVGVLADAWRATGKPTVSLWGNVPHYISATPNPQIALALLRRVAILLGTTLPVSVLENHARAFNLQVDEALKSDPEALEYVRQLEQQHPPEAPSEDAPGLIEALEEFLRSTRPPEDSGA
jgi:proteasome assembly chaperone (PAC2) family protein